MQLEDELVAIEVIGINTQAAVPVVVGNPIIVAIVIAVVGTMFCYVKVWHRHRRAGV
ncbi:MAG: hypothetical protein JRM99_09305 [Nitrososphaerota archaeon]|nr:hypothetical protein [Nitrososphaerota archaeon]MDG6991593.1 hypothetical protein [Nitrososphaerota archaeon]